MKRIKVVSFASVLLLLLPSCVTGTQWGGSKLRPTATTVYTRSAATTTLASKSFSYPRSSTTRSVRRSLSRYSSVSKGNQESRLCSSSSASLGKNLIRGALLRIASDISGGTPLETIKCRVTITKEGPFEALRNILKESGIAGLWTGTPSRTIEGALLGAVFMGGSITTKKQILSLGGSKTLAALGGGLVGGIAQSLVMTPAGMIFTSLNHNRGKSGFENETAFSVTKRIINEKGLGGMFIGIGPMAARQASNWASRSMFTEIARSTFGMSKYGLLGEIGSGVIGGIGSCWNTPIETVRVIMQRDVSAGIKPMTFGEYIVDIKNEQGVVGLFRGVNPRGVQAIWQTVFLVVVPNLLGI